MNTSKLRTLLSVPLVAFFGLQAIATANPAERPNIVIIFTDDQGFGDVACYGGAEGYTTPNLDKMADEGMRFTDFHSAHCVCSASRAALLTGRHATRWGGKSVYFPRDRDGMPQREITIAETLKEQGYATAAIGKWHLGHRPGFLPTDQGFDMYFGIPYSNDMAQDGDMPLAKDAKFLAGLTLEDYRAYRPHSEGPNADNAGYRKYKNRVPLMSGEEVIEWPVDQRQITRRFTEKAIEFIDANKEKPFFVYLAHSMPHTPLYASEQFEGKTERGLYGDVIEEIDWSVGQVLQALRERGLEENTLVVFTTDNGPWLTQGVNGGSSGPLRDGKGSSFEGGQRVPGIFWWPGKIQAGAETDFSATAFDLMPTINRLTGAQLPADLELDGIDISAVLAGEEAQAPKRDFFVYARGEAIRVGDWKYYSGPTYGRMNPKGRDKKAENPKIEALFNLKEDLAEQNNVIEQYPEKARELKQLLGKQWSILAPGS